MVETIEDAIASFAESLPDASLVMRCGDSEGVVLSSSSRDLSGETISADAPQEMRRVTGRRRDFPALQQGCAVELGQAWHIVTSLRTDPVGASVTIGLSASLDEVRVSYSRPGTHIRQPLDALAVESGVVDPYSDAVAPTTARAWFVAFPAAHWLETADPQVGDHLQIEENNLRVFAVAKHDGYWLLTCRARR